MDSEEGLMESTDKPLMSDESRSVKLRVAMALGIWYMSVIGGLF